MVQMDILIKNGKIVLPDKVFDGDVFIKNGKIACIDKNLNEDAKIIDATGKVVMPCGIDAHTHLEMPFMGAFSTDDFYTGSNAALYGATSAVIDYAMQTKDESLKSTVEKWQKKAEKSLVDTFFHVAVVPPVENIIDELEDIKKMGINSIKCFLAYKGSLMVDDEGFLKLMCKAKELDMVVCIHAEDGEEIEKNTEKLIKEDKFAPKYHAESRPAELEAKSVRKVIKMARETGAKVYFVHISTFEAIKEIQKAKEEGLEIYAESCPQYFLLDETLYEKEDFEGAKYVMSPPLRTKEDVESLQYALKQGWVDVIATDHCPFNYEKEKQMGKDDFRKIPNGIPGIETRMSLMLDLMVNRLGLSLIDFVKLNCSNPAKIFGIKNKGAIKECNDAEMAIFDMNKEWIISSDLLHENVDYTPFEGIKLKAKPEMIVFRDKIIELK